MFAFGKDFSRQAGQMQNDESEYGETRNFYFLTRVERRWQRPN